MIGMYGGSFNPLHNGHVKCIKKALNICDELHLIIGELPGRDDFDINTKLSWFHKVFETYNNIYFHILKDDSKNKSDYTLDMWLEDAEKIKKMIGKHIDIVFCGKDYDIENNPYLLCYPDSRIVYFDRDDNISSSRFRSNPSVYKDDVPFCVYESYCNLNKKEELIIGMTFPKQDTNLGLEPSLLTVFPEGNNVIYSMNNDHNYSDDDVLYYLCSVYITGMNEFIEWSKKHKKEKIIVGGYEPTMNPSKFTAYADRIIIGPCDDFYETIEQEGQIIKGITNYKKIPRYDLYDVKNNQQIIPDKEKYDICTSINTSQGCPFQCDFCCSPLMCDHIMSKPLSLVQDEINYLKRHQAKYIFIRDENFPLQKDWKEKLEIINQLGAKIYLFASANLCTEETVKYMKEHGVYMVCLGLEDITVEYKKNDKLEEVCERMRRYGIYIYLSFIVNPLKVNTYQKNKSFYNRLLNRVKSLKADMVCGNFLMPFPGTKIWDDYKEYVVDKDFDDYNSKSAFLEKNSIIRKEIEYQMYQFQNLYYHSDFYKNNCRVFNENDTLGLRFKELADQFKDYNSIWED